MNEFDNAANTAHIEFLKNLYNSGRFPHVLVINGPEPEALNTLTLFAASLLLCKADTPACGSCISCEKIKSGNHPDVTFIKPGNKAKSIGVDQIRSLKAEIYVSPHESDRRVFIIPNAHLLTRQAQNAALKIFEEPPKTTHFLLSCPNSGDLIETIKSRAVFLSTDNTSGSADKINNFDESVTNLLKAILAFKRYDIMVILNGLETDRESYGKSLEKLKTSSIALLKNKDISALQCNSFVDIIENAIGLTQQNVSLSLISTVLTNQLLAAISI